MENDDTGLAEVMAGIRDISEPGGVSHGPRTSGLSAAETAYADWLKDKSPERLSRAVEAFYPTINSEITRYSGPKTLLRSKAKALTINAIKTFNPMSGARLQSWVVTNLKPLARYSIKQRDVRIPEVAARQAAMVNRAKNDLADEYGREPTDEEIADELGITVRRVRDVKKKAVASVSSGTFDEMEGDDAMSVPGVSSTDRLGFATDAVYSGLDSTDKFIFDGITGSHGAAMMRAKDVASALGVSQASVSQRANRIGRQIADLVNNV